MSTVPIIPLASIMPGVAQPDSNWEYLETVIRPYTIELYTQYRNTCLMAVNNNIIKFHKDPATLDMLLQRLLTVIANVNTALGVVHAKHSGRTGYALGSNDITNFLSISEEYVRIQSDLMGVYNEVYLPLQAMTEQAHAAATAASAANKGNV